MDINKLKKVRNTLRLQFGGGIPKYSKQVGNVTIYSDDGKIWYEDYINKIPTTIHPNIPDQTMSLNDINQFSQNSLNLNYITNLYNKDNLPITEPLSYPAKLSRTGMSLTQQDIQPLSNSINFENNEIPEKIEQFTPKLSKKISYKHELDEIKKLSEANDEESKKQLELANKSAEQTISGIGTMATNIGQIFNAKQQSTDSNLTKGADAVYDGIADTVGKLGPYGKVIGGAMKALGALGDISLSLGGGTDQQTTTDKWMDSSFFSWNIGAINGIFGKNSNSFSADLEILAKAGGSYGGSADTITDAADKAGKKYGLFSSKSRREANDNIARAKAIQNKLGNITNTAEDLRLAAASIGEQAGLAYSLMTDGGYNLKYTYAAKQGGILKSELLEWEPQIELNWELENKEELLEWIPEFKQGGSIEDSDIPDKEETTQKNVIPEGALHKNKHHMEHAEGLTKKGIPVIDNDGELQAEVEKEEWTMTLELTKTIENLYDLFYSEHKTKREKEEVALLAGKILVDLILYNTDDRAGLIESCKLGGTLTWKKPIDVESTPKKDIQKDLIKEAVKEVILELIK